jgi:hypothetical protein
MRCVLAQIRINKVHEVIAQITRDNFFYERTRAKTWLGQAQTTINQGKGELAQITRDNFFL